MLSQRLAQVLCSGFQDLGTLVVGEMLSLDSRCILLNVAAGQSLHNEYRECTAFLNNMPCISRIDTEWRLALLLWTLHL